jgi:hypothetical protein
MAIITCISYQKILWGGVNNDSKIQWPNNILLFTMEITFVKKMFIFLMEILLNYIRKLYWKICLASTPLEVCVFNLNHNNQSTDLLQEIFSVETETKIRTT